MSEIHYFPRYHKHENVVTNNTLLLFNLFYQKNPSVFEALLNELLGEDLELKVGVRMVQQEGSRNDGTPDGSIGQESFKILIETKTDQSSWDAQLLRHLRGFKGVHRKVLLLLNPERVSVSDKVLEKARKEDISIYARSFEDIIQAANAVISDRDFELRDMVQDYEGFCDHEHILPWTKYFMRAITAGSSKPENLKYGVYFEDLEKPKLVHRYLGLYASKEVFAIGEVVNSVMAELKNGELVNVKSDFPGRDVTQEQRDRIKAIIEAAPSSLGAYHVETGCRFFVVDHFRPISFKKRTLYPIRKYRDFDLRKLIECNGTNLPDADEIARQLDGKKWD
jgi:hypothetical protein